MDGFQQTENVIVIAATNFPESLDQYVRRWLTCVQYSYVLTEHLFVQDDLIESLVWFDI